MYGGGKDGAGVFQRIVNEMPPHKVFVSAFLGDCPFLRRKRPAAWNVGIDLDSAVCAAFVDRVPAGCAASFDVYCADAVQWLWDAFDLGRVCGPVRADGTVGRFGVGAEEVLVYADPPYLASTRRSSKAMYRFELDLEGHRRLLGVLRAIPARVVVSHYPCAEYDGGLAGWRSFTFTAGTRRGPAQEKVWANFEKPAVLHDCRWLGRNKREREKFARRRRTLMRRLRALSEVERQSILVELG